MHPSVNTQIHHSYFLEEKKRKDSEAVPILPFLIILTDQPNNECLYGIHNSGFDLLVLIEKYTDTKCNLSHIEGNNSVNLKFRSMQFQDVTSVDQLASHILWEVTEPKAANQAFNVVNGDVFR